MMGYYAAAVLGSIATVIFMAVININKREDE